MTDSLHPTERLIEDAERFSDPTEPTYLQGAAD